MSKKQGVVTRESDVPAGFVPTRDLRHLNNTDYTYILVAAGEGRIASVKLMRNSHDKRGHVYVSPDWQRLLDSRKGRPLAPVKNSESSVAQSNLFDDVKMSITEITPIPNKPNVETAPATRPAMSLLEQSLLVQRESLAMQRESLAMQRESLDRQTSMLARLERLEALWTPA